MKKIYLLFALSCCFFFANAQRGLINGALNNAANAAARGVGNAISKKAESIAEKQMEVFLNRKLSAYEKHLTEENKKYQEAMGAWQDSLIAMTNVPFEDEYIFNTIINTEIVMTDEKGEKETIPCTYYLNSNTEYFGYGANESITVIDYKNNVMVCFSASDTNKVYFAYKYIATDYTTATENTQKISGSKTICGYTCSGYTISNMNFNGNCWASNSSDFNGKYTNLYVPKSSYGYPLLMEGTITGENNSKVKYTSEAKSVKKNAAFKIAKADYKNMFE
ncbi:MAG: hypothetical protein MJ198_00415 [Bacteroidales bacterium]|nr:hypothetical protein [Bacteroidales bacterium]